MIRKLGWAGIERKPEKLMITADSLSRIYCHVYHDYFFIAFETAKLAAFSGNFAIAAV